MRGRLVAGTMLVLLLVAACGGKGGGAGKDPAGPVGKVAAVVGDVTVTRPGTPAAAPVAVGLVVLRDMTFKTGAGASLEVQFDNNYTWKLSEGRERAIAKLRVVDLPRAEGGQTIDDGLADSEADRTTGAGRHAEQSAAESASTLERPTAALPESAAAPAPVAAPAPDPAPLEDDEAAAAPPRPTRHKGEEGMMGKHKPKESPKSERERGGGGGGGGGNDEVEDLFKDASGPKSAKDSPPPPPPPPPGGGGGSALPDRPDAASIKAAMAPIVPEIKKCWEQYKVDGTLKAKVTINGDGKVTSVTIVEPFGGTDTGKCAEQAIRAGTFPRSNAASFSFSYPVKLGP